MNQAFEESSEKTFWVPRNTIRQDYFIAGAKLYVGTFSVRRGALWLSPSINERWCSPHVGCERRNPAGPSAKRIELWSSKLYGDSIHLKKTLATATPPVSTKRGVASFPNLGTKKLKCFWLPVHLLPICLCSFFYGCPVASWGCGWILSPALRSSPAPFEPLQSKEPTHLRWALGVRRMLVCCGGGAVGGRRRDISTRADGAPLCRWGFPGFSGCRGTWRWLGEQDCSCVLEHRRARYAALWGRS